MKNRKLLLALPAIALLSGCSVTGFAKKAYNKSKNIVMGHLINPILDKIDGGEKSVVEGDIAKATRLFKNTFTATNAHYDITREAGDKKYFSSYIYADNKFQAFAYDSEEDLTSGDIHKALSSVIYTSEAFYVYRDNAWEKEAAVAATMAKYKCFNLSAADLMDEKPVSLIEKYELKNTSGTYSCTGAVEGNFDNTLYSSCTCNMLLSFNLNENKTSVSKATIVIRKNYKVINSEETVGETVTYNINVKSISGNEIQIPEVEETETK